ncbi:TPA: DUF3800 domain-containing protein [Enterococcus faecalis]|nr:DUF3800 domain-containing protein [Enterococcus faecalis]HCT6554185.1 DUF3800 domain-containing protein [Enterococcus faecalis]
MQKVYFYFDDSGVLHRNSNNRYFVYAGLVFIGNETKENAKRKYRAVNSKIKKSLGRQDELKACNLKRQHKHSLYRVLKNEESAGLTVDINRVSDRILYEKKAIHRYKDYVLKILVKRKLEQFIKEDKISKNEDIEIFIFVDEQPTSSNGFYGLRESIYEELHNGISNYNYGTFYPPIFSKGVSVNIEYCNSANNYLIQASDILANRIWTSFKVENENLRMIPNHLCLHLP